MLGSFRLSFVDFPLPYLNGTDLPYLVYEIIVL